jgi:hypothetical protein
VDTRTDRPARTLVVGMLAGSVMLCAAAGSGRPGPAPPPPPASDTAGANPRVEVIVTIRWAREDPSQPPIRLREP